jgi:ribonuclease HI
MKVKNKLNKYLNSLKKELADDSLSEAFSSIKKAINNLPDQADEADSGEFVVPKEIQGNKEAVAIFSDGACRGNPGPGAWGTMAQDSEGKILFELSEVDGQTTNNRMEMSGALEGMKYLLHYLNERMRDPNHIDVHVITDSKYLVDGMNSWVAGWKKRGWRKADKKVPENVELWQKLDEIRNHYRHVQFHWVKGHAGHPQNEFCDQLANQALDHEGY